MGRSVLQDWVMELHLREQGTIVITQPPVDPQVHWYAHLMHGLHLPVERASEPVRALLQWLIGHGHADVISSEDVMAYYERIYPVTPYALRSRRGAVGRMWRELHELGYVADGRITRLGRRAAQ
jgi:hypothetical protein